jgi:hypothetical protein
VEQLVLVEVQVTLEQPVIQEQQETLAPMVSVVLVAQQEQLVQQETLARVEIRAPQVTQAPMV